MGFQDTCKAISDPTRRKILELLKSGRMTAGDIAASFNMTQATISHHLSTLKQAGLIDDEHIGKFIYYELNLSVLEEMMSWVAGLMESEGEEEKCKSE